MLVRFICENFLSFGNKKDAFEFLNTAASKTKSLPNHVVKISQNISVLKGAAIYGANASGKTNFVKAISFAKNIIESRKKGIEEHNLGSFQNKFCKSNESKFVFEFKLSNLLYEYGFCINSKEVVGEWLCATNLNGKRVKTFFEREKNKIINDKKIAAIVKKDKKDGQFFEKYLKKALEPNQLLLHRLLEDNVKFAQDLLNWFKKIVVIRDFNYSSYFAKKELFEFAKEILKQIDKQIDDISVKEEEINKASDISGIPFEIAEKVFSDLSDHCKSSKKDISIAVTNFSSDQKIYLSAGKNGIRLLKILINRKNQEFSLSQESDGIRRIFDLIPMLFGIKNNAEEVVNKDSIFIIDEIEKSLHPHIVEEFIKMFFEFGKDSESQIILTTHDTNLLDLTLFRKDEIWFVEKNKNLSTQFTSLAEFKDIREDLVISKGYLQGRFGAIPFIGNWRDK
jgi:AAA15 family ATPase/GTPase